MDIIIHLRFYVVWNKNVVIVIQIKIDNDNLYAFLYI